MDDVTQILSQIDQGDPRAAEQLLPLVYEELRKLAAAKMAQEKPGQTLQATALVHDAYLRLVDVAAPVQWSGRGHFFAAAAEAMRRILIENARRKQRLRHGGAGHRVDVDLGHRGESVRDLRILELDEALDVLEEGQPMVAQVVKLRYFAGLSVADTAAALDLSVRTVNRHWQYARARLFRLLETNGN